MNRTIELLGLIETDPKSVPIVKPFLGKNTDRKDRDGDSFYCRSETGLL